ncbi:MAG: N-acetylglucosamine-6-phosphate deacetylase [Clostridia bacterium]|nr:N-acetylglucosamine-6-phosphate deacetylase [Clostridia bacterium]
MIIKNGNVLLGSTQAIEQADIRIEQGTITEISHDLSDRNEFDASGLLVIPGFIDIHIHGCVGVEFASPDEDFTKARQWLASEGVTGFAATVRAMTPDRIVAAEKNILREAERETVGASVLGINLEGPFVSKVRTGVMNPPDIECNPETAKLFADEGKGMLKIMTLAPERENALDVVKIATENGVNISLGHTDATYSESIDAINAGATRATHVFNAMRPLSHRETGVLGAVLTDDRVNCEMICDLVHLDEATIKMVYRLKGAENITLISDTGFMSGLGDGEFVIDGRKRTVKNGVCRNADGRIAGSCVSMLAGAKNLLKMGIPISDISLMASLNPAKALSVDSITGTIEVGKQADIIVCDSELNIKAVFVKGIRI